MDLPSFEVESLESALRVLAEKMGLKAGQLFGILRLAVTGQPVSPPLIESMVVVGKQEVLDRIERATVLLEKQIARK
jgi:glutamyl-tRNA synthetase